MTFLRQSFNITDQDCVTLYILIVPRKFNWKNLSWNPPSYVSIVISQQLKITSMNDDKNLKFSMNNYIQHIKMHMMTFWNYELLFKFQLFVVTPITRGCNIAVISRWKFKRKDFILMVPPYFKSKLLQIESVSSL